MSDQPERPRSARCSPAPCGAARISPVVDELGARFTAAGEQIALVGGPVRDAMLGRLHNDLDLTTSARPEKTEKLLAGWADAVWDMGRAFGTIGSRKGDWQSRSRRTAPTPTTPTPASPPWTTATPSRATWLLSARPRAGIASAGSEPSAGSAGRIRTGWAWMMRGLLRPVNRGNWTGIDRRRPPRDGSKTASPITI